MSEFDENIHPAAPEPRIDMLVDGELSEADRRALLLQLEHDPDGWRRCALAFLEAQCWKAELGQMAAPAAPQQHEPVAQAVPAASPARAIGRWRSWRQHLATTLSIAASFLIALVFGMGLNGNGSGGLLHLPVKAVKDDQPLANTEQMVTLMAAAVVGHLSGVGPAPEHAGPGRAEEYSQHYFARVAAGL